MALEPSVFMAGLTMSLSLIVTMGAQNAFVLRQGVRNEQVLPVCLAGAGSDAVLITLGVTSFGAIGALLPWLEPVMRYGGAVFLVLYGARSLRSALRSSAVLTAEAADAPPGLARRLLACLAITWLNPHVYLDTVVLLGSIATGFPGAKAAFAAGAVAGSFLFFFALGFGAKRLRPVFARPLAWRMLEAVIALVMWAIALRLLLGS